MTPMVDGGREYHVLKVDGKGIAGVFGITPEMEGVPPNWSTIFAVENTDETIAKTKELGGSALMEGMDLPEIGRLAVLEDPTGAVFQVLEPPAA